MTLSQCSPSMEVLCPSCAEVLSEDGTCAHCEFAHASTPEAPGDVANLVDHLRRQHENWNIGEPTIMSRAADTIERLSADSVDMKLAMSGLNKDWNVMRERAEAAEARLAEAFSKPVGWFNPWNEYHGFQQVAKEYEGEPDKIPLYADPRRADVGPSGDGG